MVKIIQVIAASLLLNCTAMVGLRAQTAPFASASWISPGYTEASGKRPCPVFHRIFSAEAKPISKALLSVSALGLYEVSINGLRVSDHYFAPGFTNYDHRIRWQQYDVTSLLHVDNEINAIVGEGWYRGVFRNLTSDAGRDHFGKTAGLILRLDISYADGTHASLVTDTSWQCQESYIRYSELYDGEMQDSRYQPAQWQPVALTAPPQASLIPTDIEPVTRHETFSPRHTWTDSVGNQLIDFGQNLAGWVELNVKGQPGDTIRISHAEMLDKDGRFFTANLRSAKATDTYILDGTDQTLQPHFTYHGFRYARLEWLRNGQPITPTPDTDTTNTHAWEAHAVALYSDLKKTGYFSCSDSLINQLQQNIEWSLNSNFLSIPTDCPQRSERLGWTGDAQVFCGTASFLRDTRKFYGQWLQDLSFEQGLNGGLPNFIPTSSPYREKLYGVAGWGDAAVIMPWTLYQTYNDTAILRRQYPSMKAWVDYMRSVSHEGLFTNGGYGDWYAMGDSTSIPYIDQCFYTHSTDILTRTASLLGYREDADHYSSLYDTIMNAFIKTYGRFDTRATSTQTACVLALAFDLLPIQQRDSVAALLVRRIRDNGDKLATGFLGTPYLLPVLSRFGHNDIAYRLIFQRQCPSWLYPVTRNATTIWERWDAIRPDSTLQATSFNHYSYGAVGDWLYHVVAGINALEPGYRKILIAPRAGQGLTWARASYYSMYGEIISSWHRQGSKLILHVTIPPGTTAVISLPGIRDKTVGPGEHHFSSKIQEKTSL